MAEFRNIYTRIWKDDWFCDLAADEKLVFVYLFSNERASVSGIYELPIKFMAFEIGIDKARLLEILEKFRVDGKARYEDGIVWVVNLRRYNETNSPQVQTRLIKDVASIPDSNLLRDYCKHYSIPYPYGIDTLPIPVSKSVSDTETETDTETDTDTETETDTETDTDTETETDTPAADPFDSLQRVCEGKGIILGGEADIRALREIVSSGATAADLEAAIVWKAQNNNGRAVLRVTQLVGPTRTAVAKRLQSGNGKASTGDTFVPAEVW